MGEFSDEKTKDLIELCKLELSILTDGKIIPNKSGIFPSIMEQERVHELGKLQEKYNYGWYIAEQSMEDQIKSINEFKKYIIEN